VNIVLPTLGAGMLLNGEWLQYALQYIVQHLSVCLPLPIQPLLRNIVFLDWNWEERDYYNAVGSGRLADLGRYIANCHIYRPLLLVARNI
jgi:hypothetical protein